MSTFRGFLAYFNTSNRRPVALLIFWVLLVATALFPFLFLGRLFIDGDSMLQYYPIFDFYHRAIVTHQSFLWNPAIFLGFPVYLSQSAGLLDPLNWMLFHLPTFLAYHLRLAIDLVLVLGFSYAAARELGRSRVAALLVGMGYIVAFNWRYLSNVVITNSLFLVPLLWYAGLRLFRAQSEKERWGWVCVIGAGIGWSLVAGYAQFTVYTVFLFGVFYIWYFFFQYSGSKDVRALLRWGSYGLMMLVIGGCLALPQILPALSFKSLTARSEGVPYELATYKTVEPGDVILFAFPDYLYFPYISSGRKPLYIGILLFLFALVGIREVLKRKSGDRRKDHERNTMRAIFLIALFCFVASLKWSPLYYMMQKLPVFELFRFPYRWMYVGVWFVCILGAYGFDRFYEQRAELRSAWLTRFVGFGGLTLIGIVGALNLFGDRFWLWVSSLMQFVFAKTFYGHAMFTKDLAHYHEAFDRGIDAWRTFLSIRDISFGVPFSIFIAAFLLVFLTMRGRCNQAFFRMASLIITIITFVAVFAVQWPYSISQEAAESHMDMLDQGGVRNELMMYRTFPFRLTDSLSAFIQPTYRLTNDQVLAVTEMQFGTGWPNMHMYDADAASVDGYDVYVSSDLSAVLGMIGSTHGGGEETKRITAAENITRLTDNLDVLGMLSGKFIISGVEISNPALRLRATSTVSHLGGTAFIYENEYALPRWYFATSTVSHSHASLMGLLSEIEDGSIAAQTYIDCKSCDTTRVSSSDTITVTSQTFAHIEFATRTLHPRWFIFTESYLPGWILYIDGVKVPITRSNGMLMSAYVPAGEHQLRWEYVGVLNEARILKWLRLF